jgi:phosphonate degradation associated HDIG domain protein
MTPQDLLRKIEQLFRERGSLPYGGEAVTQLEHALQAAELARSEGRPPTLIAASLLHDIGHLLHGLGSDCAEEGIDDRHEDLGMRFLQKHFPESVTRPVRLHVDAKRYLCGVEPGYAAGLSGPSILSMELQGGAMNAAEAAAFRRQPYAEDSVQLRRYDDSAKVPGLSTPGIETFLPYLEECLK